MKIQLPNEQATLEFGAKLAESIPTHGVIFLFGKLGAGKTTLVRGFLKAIGHKGSTKSPTYTLVEPYQISTRKIYHFDLYRVDDPEELEYMGFRDYLEEKTLCFIEWPEKGDHFLPVPDLVLKLDYLGEQRTVEAEARNSSWEKKLDWILK